ncbi:SMP-30/gluconolactonase/LRE family protein [Aquihabitans sp. G128]|uniref:SMP-30/gluconolactonase/LRE family protein n=1 Tax=Aquihabitans sp. G128 TaxID=2849779 RepID=UPI001C23BD76|nr:SMP-30/gluconolactonase/LRE family protein [Aquihabitans sp. G128]QXC60906.1 SMP-30/gluconolactonase/LRE family protein [Aquihabitans sp. G128]
MAEVRVVAEGIVMGESVRWHDGRAWLCDWGAGTLLAVDLDGTVEVVPDLGDVVPWTVDWLPDGRLLVVPRGEPRLVRVEADGRLATHADLAALAPGGCNELVVDGRGNAYLNAIGYDMLAGEAPTTGTVLLVTPDGSARQVADDVHFPNGMAVTPDGSTLVVAESHANRLTAFTIEADGSLSGRRPWAEMGTGTPDGICTDAEGAIWYADVPNACCTRVLDGGEVTQVVPLGRGGFSCALGGPDRRTLLAAATTWRGAETFTASPPAGRLLAADVEVAAAGWPSP